MNRPDSAPRWVDLEGAHNVRDLGGLPAGPGRIADRALYRGDSIDVLTPGDVALLTQSVGLRAVIDLRSDTEAVRAADWMPEAGIVHHHISLFDLTGETSAGLRRNLGQDVSAAYRAMMRLASPAFVRIVDVVTGDPGPPVLVHCAAGKDRTGIVVAVLLSAVGVPDEIVVADYLATGERLERVRAALRRRALYDPGTTPPPPFGAAPIEAVLSQVREEYGGADGFLDHCGVSEERRQRLRQILLTMIPPTGDWA